MEESRAGRKQLSWEAREGNERSGMEAALGGGIWGALATVGACEGRGQGPVARRGGSGSASGEWRLGG